MSSQSETSSRQVKNILVIDDDVDIRQLVLKLFSNYTEYGIIVANDGKEALDIMQNVIPDIIICDIMMPYMDGLELFVNLKHNKRLSNVPFLFISANNSNEDSLLGFGLGADDYIVKPFNAKDLFAKVKRILDREEGENNYDVNNSFQLAGSISTTSIKEVLQLLAVANSYRNTLVGSSEPNRSTLVVDDISGNPMGALYIQDGNIINAIMDGNWGIESVYKLLDIREGFLKYYPNGFNVNVEPTVNQPIGTILALVGENKKS